MKPSANKIEVKAMRLSHGLGLPLPQYQTEEAAGLDLLAAVPLTTPLRLLPGMRQLVPTGLTVEIPPGFEGQIRPRSGLALNHGVTVLNSPGTVDSDYRGEIKVLLVNLGRETFVITRGQRIAQLVIGSVARAELVDVRAVAASRRGDAGFGSTGLASPAGTAHMAPPPAPRAPALPKMPVVPAAAAAPPRKAVPAPAQSVQIQSGQAQSVQTKPAPSKAAPSKAAPSKVAPAKPAVAAKPGNSDKALPPAEHAKAKQAAAKPTAPAGKSKPAKTAPAKKPAARLQSAKAQPAKRPVAPASKAKVPARA